MDIEDFPRTLREYEAQLVSLYSELSEWRQVGADEWLFEETARTLGECVAHATFFGFPTQIRVPLMLTPLAAMGIIGRVLKWVRREKLSESPFLSVNEAAAFLRTTTEGVYRAVEARRLECGRVGKELRFTREQLSRYGSESPKRKAMLSKRKSGSR